MFRFVSNSRWYAKMPSLLALQSSFSGNTMLHLSILSEQTSYATHMFSQCFFFVSMSLVHFPPFVVQFFWFLISWILREFHDLSVLFLIIICIASCLLLVWRSLSFLFCLGQNIFIGTGRICTIWHLFRSTQWKRTHCSPCGLFIDSYSLIGSGVECDVCHDLCPLSSSSW